MYRCFMNFSITTLGCKVNQYEAAAVATSLEQAGLRRRAFGQRVDLLVVNTCCVTRSAMRKTRQALGRALRSAPDAVVLVTGCYCDFDPERIRRRLLALGIPESRFVLAGHHDDVSAGIRQVLRRLESNRSARAEPSACGSIRQAGLVARAASEPAEGPRHQRTTATSISTRRRLAVKSNARGTSGLPSLRRFAGHTRAFVKVQDGCDRFCTFCIVPFTRWRVWSRPIREVVRECRDLVAAGHREIVLCGVCLGAYGCPTTRLDRPAGRQGPLLELIGRAGRVAGLWRLRLSSLSPADVTDELLEVCRELPAFAPHFHLPLQSGSPRILRRMNRGYSPEQFLRVVGRIRTAFDNPAVTADVLVGFPGETAEDFAETVRVAREAGFSKIHAFRFSAIPGTAAWNYRREVPSHHELDRRTVELGELERELSGAYREALLGRVLEGIVEDRTAGDGLARVMTDRYAPVRLAAERRLRPGQVVSLRPDRVTDEGLDGRLVQVLTPPATAKAACPDRADRVC